MEFFSSFEGVFFSFLFLMFFSVPFSEKLIDGINQSEARRRALIFFCLVYLNANARVSLQTDLIFP